MSERVEDLNLFDGAHSELLGNTFLSGFNNRLKTKHSDHVNYKNNFFPFQVESSLFFDNDKSQGTMTGESPLGLRQGDISVSFYLQETQNKKVLIFADSHVSGLQWKLSTLLSPDRYFITPFIKPGAKLRDVMALDNFLSLTNHMNEDDKIVIIGGTNGIGKFLPYQLSVLKSCNDFKLFLRGVKPETIFLNVLKRYYLDVAEEVFIANSVIKHNINRQSESRKKNTFLEVYSDLKRSDFTYDGLHLSKNGKNKLAQIIKVAIVKETVLEKYKLIGDKKCNDLMYFNDEYYTVLNETVSDINPVVSQTSLKDLEN